MVYLDNIPSAASIASLPSFPESVSNADASAAEMGWPIAAKASIARFTDANIGCALLEDAPAAIA
jgi:hypothetical protein